MLLNPKLWRVWTFVLIRILLYLTTLFKTTRKDLLWEIRVNYGKYIKSYFGVTNYRKCGKTNHNHSLSFKNFINSLNVNKRCSTEIESEKAINYLDITFISKNNNDHACSTLS